MDGDEEVVNGGGGAVEGEVVVVVLANDALLLMMFNGSSKPVEFLSSSKTLGSISRNGAERGKMIDKLTTMINSKEKREKT